MIYEIKLEGRYKCAKCGSKKLGDGKTPFSIKCIKGHEERVRTRTAFEGQHMPLSIATNILIAYQETYLEFQDVLEDLIYFSEKNWELYYENKLETPGIPARIPLQELAANFKIEKNSVSSFISRIGEWTPNKYLKVCEAEDKWFQDVKNDNGKKKYTALFNLLFDFETNNTLEPRNLYDIIHFLVKKKFIKTEKWWW